MSLNLLVGDPNKEKNKKLKMKMRKMSIEAQYMKTLIREKIFLRRVVQLGLVKVIERAKVREPRMRVELLNMTRAYLFSKKLKKFTNSVFDFCSKFSEAFVGYLYTMYVMHKVCKSK